MPRVDQDIKLDFKDVLFRPKRSTLKSRSEVSVIIYYWPVISMMIMNSVQVDLHREFSFRNSKCKYNGIPIIASNMDTVGTFEMAKVFNQVPSDLSWFTVLNHKMI